MLNQQIIYVLMNFSGNPDQIGILFENGDKNNAAFLVQDYLDHMNYHLKQVTA